MIKIPIRIITIIMLLISISGCVFASKGSMGKEVSAISFLERQRLDNYISQIDQCSIRELQRLDDGVSDIRMIIDIVQDKCRGYYNSVKDMLYKDCGVGLGNAYLFTENLKKNSINKVAESIISRRKITNAQDPNIEQFRRAQSEIQTSPPTNQDYYSTYDIETAF